MTCCKQTKKSFKVSAVVAALVLLNLQPPTVISADEVYKDWVLKVETEELPRQFRYQGSNLEKVAKVNVSYFHENDPKAIKPYERVYYHNGKPIGLERLGQLGLTPTQSVVIKVSHKAGSGSEEEKATANILWRLGLDVSHNHNALISTVLPLSSFDGIARELEAIGFRSSKVENEQANNAKSLLALESEPAGRSKKLFYY